MDQRLALWLYAANTTFLVAHEVDSGYWHEWELFQIPGGPGVFVLLHLVLVPIMLWGLVLLAQSRTGGRFFTLLMGFAAMAGATLHFTLLAMGHPQFRSAISIGLIGAFGVTGLAQVIVGWRSPSTGRSNST